MKEPLDLEAQPQAARDDDRLEARAGTGGSGRPRGVWSPHGALTGHGRDCSLARVGVMVSSTVRYAALSNG